jgi:hypothetical protein
VDAPSPRMKTLCGNCGMQWYRKNNKAAAKAAAADE